MPPQLANLALPPNVPHREADVLDRAHRLHVEPDGRHRGDGLVQLQFVEQRRLARAVQSEQQDLGVLSTGERLVKALQFCHEESHGPKPRLALQANV